MFCCFIYFRPKVEVRQKSDVNRMTETEGVIPAETGDAKQGNDLYVY